MIGDRAIWLCRQSLTNSIFDLTYKIWLHGSNRHFFNSVPDRSRIRYFVCLLLWGSVAPTVTGLQSDHLSFHHLLRPNSVATWPERVCAVGVLITMWQGTQQPSIAGVERMNWSGRGRIMGMTLDPWLLSMLSYRYILQF